MRLEIPFIIFIKLAFALFLVWSSARLYTNQSEWIFMNSVSLIFHEAGHIIFSFFGHFIHILGGTLAEIGVPLIVIIHFLLQRQWYSVGFGFWWLSIAFWSVSVYASDAQAQILPLLGGDSAGHDWANILGMLGILHYDIVIGKAFLFLSILAFCVALFAFFYDIKEHYTASAIRRSG